jgi:hypothetical protein
VGPIADLDAGLKPTIIQSSAKPLSYPGFQCVFFCLLGLISRGVILKSYSATWSLILSHDEKLSALLSTKIPLKLLSKLFLFKKNIQNVQTFVSHLHSKTFLPWPTTYVYQCNDYCRMQIP